MATAKVIVINGEPMQRDHLDRLIREADQRATSAERISPGQLVNWSHMPNPKKRLMVLSSTSYLVKAAYEKLGEDYPTLADANVVPPGLVVVTDGMQFWEANPADLVQA